jgi:hypothetical protein
MSGIKTYSQYDMRVKPTEPNHLARLSDVLELIDGKTKAPVRFITDANLVFTYDGVAKTLTQDAADDLSIDGIAVSLNDRVLVNAQTDKTQNGVYKVTTLGSSGTTAAVLTRDDDMDESFEIIEGMRVFVAEGNTHAGTVWKLVGTGPWTLDTSNIEFTQDVVKYTEILETIFTATGDDSTVEYTFTHDFGTKNVTVEPYDPATGDTVAVQIVRTSVNDLKIMLGEPLGTGNNLVFIVRAVVTPV